MSVTSPAVATWKQFAYKVRANQDKLLPELRRFPGAILVTGCQRSGGTMLSRLITGSAGMTNFWFGKDEELDAAQILSGAVRYQGSGRHCFQTTYLNERWGEYLEQTQPFHMVWSLRNPHSVVYSMVYNWRAFALNEVFLTCGYAHMGAEDRVRFQRWGLWGVSPLKRAAYAYCGKVSQVLQLAPPLGDERLTVLEYDSLVLNKATQLPVLYQRLGLRFDPKYADYVSERSLGKKDKLSDEQRALVDRICGAVYDAARGLVNLQPARA